MNTTEIQKNIFQEESHKIHEEKRATFLKHKKARNKTKPKKNTLKSNKRIKKKLTQQKNKNIQKILPDDISLETNSTIITIDEESNSNHSEILQYIDDIEFVLKDICTKGIFFQNLKKFIKIVKDSEKEVNVKFSTENLKNCLSSLNLTEKMNLVLDIDETLVFPKIVKELQKGEDLNKALQHFQNNEESHIYYVKLESSTNTLILKVNVRKNMAEFFRKLSPYCNFYINTMASPIYVKEVIDILCKNYGLRFSNLNDNNVIYTSPNNKKFLPDEITKNENFLILDDNICAWEVKYIPSILPVRKFCLNDSESDLKQIFYQYYLFSNKIYCFEEDKRPFLDSLNKIPYCVENTKNEKSQLFYIYDMIMKSIILSNVLEIPIRHALHFIQNTILKGHYIYYDGFDKDFISEMINLLGGSIVNDIEKANYIIINKNVFGGGVNETDYLGKCIIDVKWVFDCFFNFIKCDENDLEYKIK